ncbi:MAG: lamin tail domain-containing protein [candidate division KSB1 bacterium]|nr:lamin tail domain-containing protein [candidate division KSB1 bacterium]
MNKSLIPATLIVLLGMIARSLAQDHLLITEIANRPNSPLNGEFVEIYNGTGVTVDLSKYYLTDCPNKGDNDYVNIVDKSYTPASYDFLAKFPDGSKIEHGQFIVVAVKGKDFHQLYGIEPDFELIPQSDTVPDMVAPGNNYIASNTGFTDASEVMVLFYWDGISDLVKDVDYLVWGDTDEAVDKTGVKKDGPDPDTNPSEYLPDTPFANQILLKSLNSSRLHRDGKSLQRKPIAEVGEKFIGGNGITGHDETSENLAIAFIEADPTPRSAIGNRAKVTFLANTATVPDTIGPNSVVQIRGVGGPLTWNSASPIFMQNIGGDYWKATVEFKQGESVQFKFFTNSHDTVFPGVEWEDQGWEGDLATSTGNRLLVVGSSDTTLPLQFINGWKHKAGQYERPYTTNDSTFVVWIRVNCQGWEDFDPSSQQIGVRGSNNIDWGPTGELSWNKTYLLNQESDHVNKDSQQYPGHYFYSGPVHVPQKYAGAGIEFKVVVHNAGAPLDEDWSKLAYNPSLQNKVALSGVDTTVCWFWFDNKRPQTKIHRDVVIVAFMADLKNAIEKKGFAFGDTLVVRSGFYGTATEIRSKMMMRQGSTTCYSAIDTIITTVGAHLAYQYYKIKNGEEYPEIYYNFLYTGGKAGEAEKRIVEKIVGNAIQIEDILDSKVEMHRMPLFRNTSLLARDVLVSYLCDVRPAIYQLKAGTVLKDMQGTVDIFDPDQVLQLGVAMNGPATGAWETWGVGLMNNLAHQMFDDGTHGDAVAGDSIFTMQIQYRAGVDASAQEFKFGIGGGDNEGGCGNIHIENIDDSEPTFTIDAQFGSIDPMRYSAWNFDLQIPSTVKETTLSHLPTEFSMGQNYPNPFNLVTEIRYTLPKETMVKLTVHNMMGQRVTTLIQKKQAAGCYQVCWSGVDESGKQLPSGVYFYRIEASQFSAVRKMLLLK